MLHERAPYPRTNRVICERQFRAAAKFMTTRFSIHLNFKILIRTCSMWTIWQIRVILREVKSRKRRSLLQQKTHHLFKVKLKMSTQIKISN